MRLVIRRGRAADARAIARVQVGCWRTTYRDILPAAFLRSLDVEDVGSRWVRRLRAIRPSRTHAVTGVDIWVATLEDEVVGFAAAHPDRQRGGFAGYGAEVSYLYVHPAFQHRGIGSLLLDQSVRGLEARGFYWLTIGVLEANRPARRFYEAHGMRRDGVSYDDPRFGATVVQYGRALNRIVDFGALRLAASR